MTYLIRHVFQIKQQNRRFKLKRFQHGYRNKEMENINEAHERKCKIDETKCKPNQI